MLTYIMAKPPVFVLPDSSSAIAPLFTAPDGTTSHAVTFLNPAGLEWAYTD